MQLKQQKNKHYVGFGKLSAIIIPQKSNFVNSIMQLFLKKFYCQSVTRIHARLDWVRSFVAVVVKTKN